MRRDDILPALIIAVLIFTTALVYFAHPAYGQGERCTVQTFDPPIGPTFTMPGDADTIRVTLADGGGQTLVGPFVIGDVVTAAGPIVALEKCTGVAPPVPPTPTATPVPPTPTVPPEDQCCTTIVTPGPTVTPTPVVIIPTPPTPPVEVTPTPVEIVPTPTPPAELPDTGSDTGPLVVAALAAIGAGLMLLGALRR